MVNFYPGKWLCFSVSYHYICRLDILGYLKQLSFEFEGMIYIPPEDKKLEAWLKTIRNKELLKNLPVVKIDHFQVWTKLNGKNISRLTNTAKVKYVSWFERDSSSHPPVTRGPLLYQLSNRVNWEKYPQFTPYPRDTLCFDSISKSLSD